MSRTVFVYGTGSIGMRHLRLLSEMPGVRAVAIPVRPERVESLRSMGFEAVARTEDVSAAAGDAAVICTDTSRHVADAQRLLDRCSLLIEKPVAVDVAETAPLAARAAGRGDVFVGYPLRFAPVIRRVMEVLPSLGSISLVRTECQSWLPSWRPGRDYRLSYSARKSEGGVLRDLSHELDYSLRIAGPPVEMSALFADRILDIEAEDAADVMWRTRGGSVVSVRLDYVTRVQRRRVFIVGSKGCLEADLLTGAIGGVVDDVPVSEVMDTAPDLMYRAQLDAFLNGRGTDNLCTLEEAIDVMKVIDAARLSAMRGFVEPHGGTP